jgi:hydrogenase nickel incorporation protein HypA/HybF
MHEVGIAQNLLKAAQQAMPPMTSPRVVALKVRLGPLAGVSPDELQFGFEIASMDTPFAGATLEIESVPVVVFCPSCQTEHTLSEPEPVHCPACGRPGVELWQGRELVLMSFEVGDEVESN